MGFGGSSSNAGGGATTARSDLDVLQVSGREQAMLNSIDQRLKIEIKERRVYCAEFYNARADGSGADVAISTEGFC